MLMTKLVVRILGIEGELLGWAEAVGEARGDGKLWVVDPTLIGIERDGVTAHVSIHWCDVNIEVRPPMEPHFVKIGSVFTIPGEWDAITCGPAAGGLPPVTVRNPVLITMLPGSLGAKGNA